MTCPGCTLLLNTPTPPSVDSVWMGSGVHILLAMSCILVWFGLLNLKKRNGDDLLNVSCIEITTHVFTLVQEKRISLGSSSLPHVVVQNYMLCIRVHQTNTNGCYSDERNPAYDCGQEPNGQVINISFALGIRSTCVSVTFPNQETFILLCQSHKKKTRQ